MEATIDTTVRSEYSFTFLSRAYTGSSEKTKNNKQNNVWNFACTKHLPIFTYCSDHKWLYYLTALPVIYYTHKTVPRFADITDPLLISMLRSVQI